MRGSLRSWIAGFTLVLFVCVIALLPTSTSSKVRGDKTKKRKNESVSSPGQGKRRKPLLDLLAPQRKKTLHEEEDEDAGYDPDLPAKGLLRNRIDKEEYQRLRDEYFGILRGVEPGRPFDPSLRVRAIEQMELQRLAITKAAKQSNQPNALQSFSWHELGPTPLTNGQTQQFPATASVSGRVTSVVVDPTNSNKVYLGTAQGGVWRSTNGGSSWTPIFDTAQSLAIGALALAPSDPTILYVGTGEPNNSADSFFGVGVYRIDNVDTAATLVGPINPSITTGTTTALTYNCFNGRAITRILVHPTDPATIFVSTAAGVSGAAGNALSNTIPPLALRGVFRSTNATAAAGTVTFSKIIVNTDGSLDAPGTGNTSIFDMALDPGFDGGANQILLVTTSGAATGGVVMRSTNALAATPTFTQTLFPGFNGLVMHLAINKVGAVVTVYVASNEPSTVAACSSIGQAGKVRKSIDGGVTWSSPLVAAEGYCGGQCTYDSPIGVDSADANVVYLGGNARGTCSDVLKKSTDGGTTFTRDDTGLHADSHAIFVDSSSSPHTVWFGNDGGVWKRPETAVAGGAPAGTDWLDQNVTGLGTVQFVSVAVHPTDQFFTIGGTQDNGTEAQTASNGNWLSAESGDGGFTLIDQSATNTVNVTMYHTFFNQTNNLIGFDRTNLGACLAVKDSWEFRGPGTTSAAPSCDGTAFAANNGISVADTVLFYAPMALGPGGAGNPNTFYFGTNKLYRSIDRGDTMTIVSQNPLVAGVAVSAIGISPTDDNVRIVGLRNGKVFATTTGSTTLTDTTFVAPTNATASATNKHVARAVIDPLNSNTAYVTLAYYTNPATAGNIWRTTNLNSATPTWTSIGNSGNGLPNIPVNAFAVDANDPFHPGVTVLYAGCDIGVYRSVDSGASWIPFGTGLPNVSIFDMAIQPTSRYIRVATHGRGMWEVGLPGNPTAAPANIIGVVTASDGSPLGGVTVNLNGAQMTDTITDSSGHYLFANVELNGFYTVTPALANYTFAPANRSFSLVANKTDAMFTGSPNTTASSNAIDTNEYFVRQQYLDFLGREPDHAGLIYWVAKLNQCNGNAGCQRQGRIDVSAAFFLSQEFQETGSYVYGLYNGALGRQLNYAEFFADRQQVVGGATLDTAKTAFANAFVARAEFTQKYQSNTTAESFVDALLQTAHDTTGADLSGTRADFVNRYQTGNTMDESRALVVRAVAENPILAAAVYNPSFVAMEYFGYLRRGIDQGGYAFWLNALNSSSAGNYRGMVCAFITSTEYQQRFGNVVTRSNSECGP
jgi:hypothetical protein